MVTYVVGGDYIAEFNPSQNPITFHMGNIATAKGFGHHAFGTPIVWTV